MKNLLSIVIFILALGFQQCNKEKENFAYCTGCSVSAWDGYYAGNGAYFAPEPADNADGIEVKVTIVNTYDSTLKITVDAPGYITENFTTSKKDEYHYINIWSDERSLDLGLSKKENEYRLTGTVKKNRYNKIDEVWEVDRYVSFETYKN